MKTSQRKSTTATTTTTEKTSTSGGITSLNLSSRTARNSVKLSAEQSNFNTVESPLPVNVQTIEPSTMAQQTVEQDYSSNIKPRSGFTRTTQSNTTGGGRTLKAKAAPVSQPVAQPVAQVNGHTTTTKRTVVTEMSSSSRGTYSPAMSANAASAVLESREREKKEMQDLNDRLASYIEKVRFLEAQNRKLAADLENLKNRWGKDTSNIKIMYEGELVEARKVIDATGQQKADLEKQIARLQEQLADYKRKYEDAMRGRDADKEKIESTLTQLSDAEAEVNLLRRRIENLEDEVGRLKKDNNRLGSDLQKARTDLDQETLNRIDYQNQVQTLLEEIEFLRRVHDQEIKELQALAARDTTAENREYFKNELAMAIRDIRNEYDSISHQNKTDMDSWYKLKVQEIHTHTARQNMETGYQKEEVKRLRGQLGGVRGKLGDLESRNSMLEKQVQELMYQIEDDQRQYEAALNDRDSQIRKMREECQALMVELQMLLDTKQTLDAEIAIYRKMLEGEENRAGLRQLVEQVVKTHSLQQQDDTETQRIVKGETATRTSFQRSAKGNVSISECNPEGKFIILENTHRSKDENLDEWKLKRKLDNKREIVFNIPAKYQLKAGKSVRIWAKNQGGQNNPPDSLVHESEESWGTGSNVQTILYNKEGDERATHIQRTQSSQS